MELKGVLAPTPTDNYPATQAVHAFFLTPLSFNKGHKQILYK
jgi:hypothetical protein